MKKVIVAPLNWGLGHATRCIPIINSLLEQGFTPILASDGAALTLLQKEYPSLETISLPSYDIRYGKPLMASLIRQVPKVLRALKKEQSLIEDYVATHKDVIGVISDNRFGVRSKKVTSVYISHQLTVFSGAATFLTSWVHRRFIKKFDACWIPDTPKNDFAGDLSKTPSLGIPLYYLGLLSRFKPKALAKKNDLLVILSGPEPNRSLLETRLLGELKNVKGHICFVRGTSHPLNAPNENLNMEIHDLLLSEALEREINQSESVICRSGYSSIMDMAVMGKKVLFIPTNGQFEQEYLARYLQKKKYANYTTEEALNLEDFSGEAIPNGFEISKMSLELPALDLFKRK